MARVPFIAIARGILRCGDRYVLCRAKGYDFWFFPGGGIEDGEDARLTLKREALEEMGLELPTVEYVATVQNRFVENDVVYNEIDIVFSSRLASGAVVQSLEDHIEARLFSVDEILSLTILPPTMKQLLLDSHAGRLTQPFIGLEA